MNTEFKAKDGFSGSTSKTIPFSAVMNSLVITNDGASNLTFTVLGNVYTLSPDVTFDEELEPFQSITVTATDSYFGYVRRSKGETR